MDNTELFSNGEMWSINRGQSCNSNIPFRRHEHQQGKQELRGKKTESFIIGKRKATLQEGLYWPEGEDEEGKLEQASSGAGSAGGATASVQEKRRGRASGLEDEHGLPLLIGGLCGRFCEWQVGFKRLGSLVREIGAELEGMLRPSFRDGPRHCLFTFLGRHACQYCPAFIGPSKIVSDLFQTSLKTSRLDEEFF
jgi:hypothetical protein